MNPLPSTAPWLSRVKEILFKHGIEPHDHQADGVAATLDGKDVVATMATGSGKTGFYTFSMIVIRAISEDPSLSINETRFPKNPAMLVVVPTRALQDNMVRCH
jgi:superfamily II DNA/RNA helicase